MIGTPKQRTRAALAAMVLAIGACGSDRGVPDGIAGGYDGGGIGGLTHYACYASPNLTTPNDGAMVVTIDPATKFQTMEGFGASMRLFDDPQVSNTLNPTTKRATAVASQLDQGKVLDALWLDLGLTRVRFLAGDGGIEPVNDNADPLAADLSKFDFSWKNGDGQLDLIPMLSLNGVRTHFVAPAAREAWMTDANPEEYAEWLMVMLRHWRDRGYELPYVSLKNEPGSAAGGGVLSAAYLRDVTKLLGARIKADGMKTKIVLPDDVSPAQAYARLQVILADADARQYVGAVAYHLGDPTDADKVKQLAEQYGIPVWVTSFSAPDLLGVATTIHQIIASGVSALDYTWGFYGDQESSQLIRLVAQNGVYERFSKTPQYFAMGQFSRFVMRGAVRVAATSSDPDLLAAAFVDGAKLIVVATYLGGPFERAVRLELGAGGPCVKRLESVRTGDAQGWLTLPQTFISSPRVSAIVPAHSITTWVGQE